MYLRDTGELINSYNCKTGLLQALWWWCFVWVFFFDLVRYNNFAGMDK